jgi:hypothetical protein
MFLNKLKSGLYCENDCGKRCGPSIAMPVLALASSHADHPLLFDVVTLSITPLISSNVSLTRLTNLEFEAQIMKGTHEMSH